VGGVFLSNVLLGGFLGNTPLLAEGFSIVQLPQSFCRENCYATAHCHFHLRDELLLASSGRPGGTPQYYETLFQVLKVCILQEKKSSNVMGRDLDYTLDMYLDFVLTYSKLI
jgi:hypothetical protein